MPLSVTSTSTLSRVAKRTAFSTPSLVESASTTVRRAQAMIARLLAASSLSGVVRPWPTVRPLVADERDVGPQLGERGDGLGADGGVRRGADPAGKQVQLDLGQAGEAGRDRDGVGDDGEPVVAGEGGGEPCGGAAGVDHDDRVGRREERDRRVGDGLLGLRVGLVALDDP